MAIDAVGGNLITAFGKQAALIYRVAVEASGRIVHRQTLRLVNIVARRTRHLRGRLKTAASFQENHLITVDVQPVGGGGLLQSHVV